MTKRYVVAFSNLSAMPVGDLPPPAARAEEFDDFVEAKEFAKSVMGNWNWVAIYDQTRAIGLTRVETYRRGLRFTV